jgi:hypothetical protein
MTGAAALALCDDVAPPCGMRPSSCRGTIPSEHHDEVDGLRHEEKAAVATPNL